MERLKLITEGKKMKLRKGSNIYYSIDVGEVRTSYALQKRFGDNCRFEYFEKLMTKLKESVTKDGSGFWNNRDMILGLAKNLSIIVSDATGEIVAFHIIKKNGEIVFFQVFEQGQGIGKWLVERARYLRMDRELFIYDVVPESLGFWEKVGVPIR